MSDKTAVAIGSMKAAQAEMVQWENRIETLKSDNGNLQRQKEQLQGEIDAKRSEYEAYVANYERQLRERQQKLSAEQQTLDAQREEFKQAVESHLKDKQQFGQTKLDFEKEKAATGGRRQAVEEFIQAVRRAYNVLPD